LRSVVADSLENLTQLRPGPQDIVFISAEADEDVVFASQTMRSQFSPAAVFLLADPGRGPRDKAEFNGALQRPVLRSELTRCLHSIARQAVNGQHPVDIAVDTVVQPAQTTFPVSGASDSDELVLNDLASALEIESPINADTGEHTPSLADNALLDTAQEENIIAETEDSNVRANQSENVDKVPQNDLVEDESHTVNPSEDPRSEINGQTNLSITAQADIDDTETASEMPGTTQALDLEETLATPLEIVDTLDESEPLTEGLTHEVRKEESIDIPVEAQEGIPSTNGSCTVSESDLFASTAAATPTITVTMVTPDQLAKPSESEQTEPTETDEDYIAAWESGEDGTRESAVVEPPFESASNETTLEEETDLDPQTTDLEETPSDIAGLLNDRWIKNAPTSHNASLISAPYTDAEIETVFDMTEPEFEIQPPVEEKVIDRSMRILVAEDNKTNRIVIEKMLKTLNIDLVFAENGQEAVDHFKWQRPDVFFTDISMPKMDGKEAARQIRTMESVEQLSRCPIVAITAHAMEGDAEDILAAGIDHYLTKPVKKAALIEHILNFQPNGTLPVTKDAAVEAIPA